MEVDIVLPGKNNLPIVQWASMAHWWQVLEYGCRLWLTPRPFDHSKLFVVDDCWSLVGSANLDRWSFRWNLEANQEIDSATVADTACALFERDFVASRAVSRHHWGQRGWLDRMRENIAGRLDRLLDSWRRP